MEGLKRKIKHGFTDAAESVWHSYARKNETKKFNMPKRKAIWKTVCLTDKQKKQIDDLYVKNYGEKIPYTWHRHYTAFTGNFDPNYFPELLYIPEFEYYMNTDKSYCRVFADKNVLPVIAKCEGVHPVRTILSATFGIYRDENGEEIRSNEVAEYLGNAGEVFMKPSIDSCSGHGCFTANLENGTDTLSGEEVSRVIGRLGDDFVCQERMKCHKSLFAIYPGSVNTLRIITYRWKDEYYHFPIILRVGQGGNCLDNAHAGGMFVAVDDDGTLHKTAFTEFRKSYEAHPDTGVVFDEYKIPLVPKVIEAAMKMCRAMPQIGCINWDFTIDPDGEPVLIEANTSGGSIWLAQMSHGCGIFGERTAEVLRWLNKMKKTKAHDRVCYRFGNMPE